MTERIRPATRRSSRHAQPRASSRTASVRAKPVRATSAPRGRRWLALPAAIAVIGWGAALALAPPPAASEAEVRARMIERNAQTISVGSGVATSTVVRDGYTATVGAETYALGGTNYDWAKLVMTFAGWPTSEGNITVFTRWMRQENGADDWWNRNNPLNNGWGSGGGSGLGSYDTLTIAAENAAESLHKNRGYAAIAAGFAASAPTEQIEAAIWASPWASSHYANGSHWHYTPVDVVTAPPEAWGR